jgi:hypothetical protein
LHLWTEQGGDAAANGNIEELRAAIGEMSSEALLATVAGEGSISVWAPGEDGSAGVDRRAGL